MPRESLDIRFFNKGTITAADRADVIDDAAQYSLDLDMNANGKLTGRWSDNPVLASDEVTTLGTGFTSLSAFMQRDSGKVDLVYHNSDTRVGTLIEDYYGDRAVSSLPVSGTRDVGVMISDGRNVRYGMGNNKETPPKWIGRVQGDRSAGTSLGDVQVTDAECRGVRSDDIPAYLLKSVLGATSVFGISQDNKVLYKFNQTTGEVELRDEDSFTILRSIDFDGTNLWVLEQDAFGTYILHNIDESDLSANFSVSLGPTNIQETIGGADSFFTDIASTTDNIFFAVYSPNVKTGSTNYTLWKIEKPTQNGSATLFNISCRATHPHQSGSYGIFRTRFITGSIQGQSTTYGAAVHNPTSVGLTPFVKLAADRIGWACWWEVVNARVTQWTMSTTPMLMTYTGSGYADWGNPSMLAILKGDRAQEDLTQYIDLLSPNTLAGWKGNPLSLSRHIDTNGNLYWGTGSTVTRGAVLLDEDITGDPASVFTSYTNASWVNNITSASLRLVGYDDTNDLLIASVLSDYAPGLFTYDASGDSDNPGTELTGELFLSGFPAFTLAVVTAGGAGNILENTTYIYSASYTYDGLQESPLSEGLAEITNGGGVSSNHTISIQINDLEKLNPRITAVNVYMSSFTVGDRGTLTLSRLIATIPIKMATWVEALGSDSDGSDEAVTMAYQFVNEDPVGGVTYDNRTGISETLTSTIVFYGLAVIHNSSLFVAQCYKKGLDDGAYYLFKSKPFRFDTFNWPEEYVRLPFLPTAIASFAGKVFVFGESKFARINSEGMFIEDIIDGVGAMSRTSVFSSDFGLFFCDKYNVYHHDGKSLTAIGEPIRTTNGVPYAVDVPLAWDMLEHVLFNPIITYDARTGTILVFVSTNSITSNIWCYHPLKQRWDLWSIDLTDTGSSGGSLGSDEDSFLFTFENIGEGAEVFDEMIDFTPPYYLINEGSEEEIFKEQTGSGNLIFSNVGTGVEVYAETVTTVDESDVVVPGFVGMGALIAPHAEVIFGSVGGLQELGTGQERMPYTWISREFVLDDSSQVKKLYKIRILPQVGDDEEIDAELYQLAVARDGGSNFTVLSNENLGILKRLKSVVIRIIPINNQSISSVSLIFRKLVGKR